MLPLAAEIVLVHEAQDHFEDHQRVRVILIAGLGQKRRLDRLALHPEDMALEVDVGELGKLILIDVGRQIVGIAHRHDLSNDLEEISLGVRGLPICGGDKQYGEDESRDISRAHLRI